MATNSEERYFEIRSSPKNGLGAFAITNIQAGTRIILERPIIVVPHSRYLKADVEIALFALPPERQEAFMSLASAHGQDKSMWPSKIHPSIAIQRDRERVAEQHEARIADHKTPLSVMMTNAMSWGVNSQGSAVFETASRINHSCIPSAHFAWNQNLDGGRGMETVHVVRDVADGEEILLSYCDPFYETALRRWQLKHYNFACDCKACVEVALDGTISDADSFAAASAERRYRLREITGLLGDERFGPTHQMPVAKGSVEELNCLVEAVRLMKMEGLTTPALGYL